MDHVTGLQCILCGRVYRTDQTLYTCPQCGSRGILDVVYDYDRIGRNSSQATLASNHDRSMWRYLDLLPVAEPTLIPPLQVGGTPLYHAVRLGQTLGMANLFIKDDGRNPTASLKDRASAIAVVKAREFGFSTVTCASTGNAASSLAGLAASVGLPTVIFVPERAPSAKIAQLLVFGAQVFAVQGTYDEAFDLCWEAGNEYGWYSRNTAVNPYLSEGKKTASLEICEQLQWHAPDKILVSVGDGCIIGGLWKGLQDLWALGWIDHLPQLVGVQAAGSAPLVRAWTEGTEEIVRIEPRTIADSISVGVPRDGIKALRAVRNSGGCFVAVCDDEILEAMRILGRQGAVFAEPAGATGFAGLLRLLQDGGIRRDERVVVLVTGNGLKDTDAAIQAGGSPIPIQANMAVVREAVDSQASRRLSRSETTKGVERNHDH